MLHIEYRKKPYRGTTIEFWPDNDQQIPGLRDAVDRYFQIENPALTFGNKMKSGGYEGIPEEIVVREAERVNCLHEAWTFDASGNMASANIMQVLCRLMELYVDAKKEIDRMKSTYEGVS